MKRRMSAIASAMLIGLALMNNAFSLDGTVMSDADISALVKGKRLSGERIGGAQVRMKFAENGMVSIQDGHAVESGTWSVEVGKLCLKVAKWNFDGCGPMTRNGNLVTQYFPEGDKAHIVFGK